jgi:uncharacterized protein YbaR (Trm112 family)
MTKQNERSAIDEELLGMLRCPETLQKLRLADAKEIARLNESIKSGKINNRGGQCVSEPLDGGLIREDRQFLYPIRANLPVMLIEEAIPLSRNDADRSTDR